MPQTIYVSPRSRGLFDSPPPAVVARDVTRLFAGTPALAGVSFTMDAGRVVALLGPNGAGKTTLLRILATAIRPSWGSLRLDGLDPARHAAEVRERVAFLPHATGLYGDLTARENLDFAARMLGLGRAEGRARVDAALAAVELADVAERRVRGFSAGMRRRIGLARLLLGSPSLVLLDEPYAALDAEAMDFVDRLLDAWRDAGVAVVVASHAAERIAARADATLRLEAGVAVEARGPAVRLLQPATDGARPDRRPEAVGGGGVAAAGASR